MTMPILKSWPYGTQRRAEVIYVRKHHSYRSAVGAMVALADDQGDAHIIFASADEALSAGDRGVLTFTQGGPSGGYWAFRKDNSQ
jgi:hypothetical protein